MPSTLGSCPCLGGQGKLNTRFPDARGRCGRVHPLEHVWQSNSSIGATEGCRSVDCWFGGLSKLDGQGTVLAGPAFEPPSPNLPGWRIIVGCRVAVRRIVAIGGSSSRTG